MKKTMRRILTAVLALMLLGLWPVGAMAYFHFVSTEAEWDQVVGESSVPPIAVDDWIRLNADIGAGVTQTTLPLQPLNLGSSGGGFYSISAPLTMPSGVGTLNLFEIHLDGGLFSNGDLTLGVPGDASVTGLNIGTHTLTVSGGSSSLTLSGSNTIGGIIVGTGSPNVLSISDISALGSASVQLTNSTNRLYLEGAGGVLPGNRVSGSGQIVVYEGNWTVSNPVLRMDAIGANAQATITGTVAGALEVRVGAILDLTGATGSIPDLMIWSGTLVLDPDTTRSFTAFSASGYGFNASGADITRLEVDTLADGTHDLGEFPSSGDVDSIVSFFSTNPTLVTATGGGMVALSRGGGNNRHLIATVANTPYSISGNITGSDAPGGLDATVQLKQGGGNVGGVVTAAANGDYTIVGVPAGTYDIEVSMAGYDTGTLNNVVVTNANVTGQNLTLQKSAAPTYSINGNITGSETPGGLAATVQLKQGGSNVGGAVTADANGDFSIANVSAGTGYTLSASMSGYDTSVYGPFDVTDDTELNLILQEQGQHRTLTDAATGVMVSGYMYSGTELVVSSRNVLHENCATCEKIRKLMDAGNVLKLYDIYLDPPVELGRTYRAEIPVGSGYEGKKVSVLHCNEWRMEKKDGTIINGFVVTEVDSFSPFAVLNGLYGDLIDSDPPKTGDNYPQELLTLVMILALLGAAVVFLRERRKRRA